MCMYLMPEALCVISITKKDVRVQANGTKATPQDKYVKQVVSMQAALGILASVYR